MPGSAGRSEGQRGSLEAAGRRLPDLRCSGRLCSVRVLGRRNPTGCRAGSGRRRAGAGGSTVDATPTVDGVRRKDFVQCGVTTGVAGFSTPDAQGEWRGLDVDVCRAIAAAVLGDATKVRFTPLTAAQRFTALQTGEIDVLSRITTITFQRDVQLGIEFPAINWYDGTTFIVRKSFNVKSVKDLNGATICVSAGNDERGRRRRLLPQAPAHVHAGRDRAARGGHQRVLSPDAATPSARISPRSRPCAHVRPNPADHVVLPELISKAPFGPGVMPNDLRWMEIVRWSVYAMVNAEELGLSSDDDRSGARERRSGRAPLRRQDRRLRPDARPRRRWAYRIVKQVGNYAESFDRNLKPLGIERGLNRLWKDGGVLYVPPICGDRRPREACRRCEPRSGLAWSDPRTRAIVWQILVVAVVVRSSRPWRCRRRATSRARHRVRIRLSSTVRPGSRSLGGRIVVLVARHLRPRARSSACSTRFASARSASFSPPRSEWRSASRASRRIWVVSTIASRLRRGDAEHAAAAAAAVLVFALAGAAGSAARR